MWILGRIGAVNMSSLSFDWLSFFYGPMQTSSVSYGVLWRHHEAQWCAELLRSSVYQLFSFMASTFCISFRNLCLPQRHESSLSCLLLSFHIFISSLSGPDLDVWYKVDSQGIIFHMNITLVQHCLLKGSFFPHKSFIFVFNQMTVHVCLFLDFLFCIFLIKNNF